MKINKKKKNKKKKNKKKVKYHQNNIKLMIFINKYFKKK